MKLFEVNELGEAVVNKPWLSLIPEFQDLFRLPTGKISYERSRGKSFMVYIYFVMDFSSPLREWEESKRVAEALRFSGLASEDVKSEKCKKAIAYYEMLQTSTCRALRSYKAAQKGLDKMDEYFENIDFTQTDKQGKLLYTPNQYIDNIAKTNKAYDELEKLAKRVETELTQSTGIRGTAELGDRELSRSRGKIEEKEETWSENTPDADSPTTFLDLADKLQEYSK
jgi:hypothetical protein